MEWLTCIRSAIDYMEHHLLDIQSAEEVANHVHISPMYLQKGFQVMTGYTIGEYIRNRRLYLSALALVDSGEKVIDIAYQYGYETPESFAKAFTRFHGASPSEVRRNRLLARTFLPLRIHTIVQGGEKMDFTVQEMTGFTVIGFSREFSYENSYREIPKFWNEVCGKYEFCIYTGKSPADDMERAIYDNRIGEFGICIDDTGKEGTFRYLIAGRYIGGKVPAGLELFELPKSQWAKFKCVGPMPEALQTTNTQIWNDWLPGNAEYELAGKYNIEWYSSGNTADANYQSEIWIPVAEK